MGCNEDALVAPKAQETMPVSALTTCGWGGTNYSRWGFFNGDAMADILSPSGGTIHQYLGTGAPLYSFTYSQQAVENKWGGAGYTYWGDYNGDGRMDVVSASGSNVYMKLGLNPGFSSATWPVSNPWGGAGYTFFSDFTGDKKADIATAIGSTIYLNVSTGSSFKLVTSSIDAAWGQEGYTFYSDFNGDGKRDIVSASGSTIYCYFGQADGKFTKKTASISGQWGSSSFTKIGDIYGNGSAAIVTASGGTVYVKNYLSSQSAWVTKSYTVTNTWGSDMDIRDLNGDKKQDIISLNYSTGRVYLKIWNGAGFSEQTLDTEPVNGVVTIADVTGDGKCDITITNSCSITIWEYTGSRFVKHSS